MPSSSRARSIAQLVVIVAGLFLPTLSLVPLGGLWLWEHGFLLHWAIGAAVAVGLAYAFLRGLQRPPRPKPGLEEGAVEAGDGGDPGWSTIEAQAWTDVQRVAERLDVSKLDSREALIDLGLETVRVVAGRIHPEIKEPVWRFTLPEGLALLEQVSGRLGRFAVDSIPFSEHLTVGQARTLYRWRGAIDVVEKALDLWRLVRVVNPTTAATHELRERVARQMYAWGRAHVGERLARAYVREVGRAAIDLYGGRLRLHHADASRAQSGVATGAASPSGGLPRILVAGEGGRERSRLARALSEALEGEHGDDTRDAAPLPAEVSVADTRDVDDLASLTLDSDVLVWIAQEPREGTSAMPAAVTALRARLHERFGLHAPPVLVAVVRAQRPTPAGSASAETDGACAGTGHAGDDIVSIAPMLSESFDAHLLLARVRAALPEAKRGRIGRHRRATHVRPRLRRIWSQAVSAGAAAARILRR